jgi:hypothetical protein
LDTILLSQLGAPHLLPFSDVNLKILYRAFIYLFIHFHTARPYLLLRTHSRQAALMPATDGRWIALDGMDGINGMEEGIT